MTESKIPSKKLEMKGDQLSIKLRNQACYTGNHSSSYKKGGIKDDDSLNSSHCFDISSSGSFKNDSPVMSQGKNSATKRKFVKPDSIKKPSGLSQRNNFKRGEYLVGTKRCHNLRDIIEEQK